MCFLPSLWLGEEALSELGLCLVLKWGLVQSCLASTSSYVAEADFELLIFLFYLPTAGHMDS